MAGQHLSAFSRRSFLQASTAASAALALRIVTEPMLAYARWPAYPNDAVLINSNENPLGPCSAAREAVAAIMPQSGRYLDHHTDELIKQYAQNVGVAEEQTKVYAGSSEPLHYTVMAFTSPKASFVTADPGYEAGVHAARHAGARVVNVPLTKTYAHDVRAMLAAAPDAGVFYVCTPNNPTGTLTSHSDIEYLVESKPKGSIVLVDEAYIHFCDAPTAIDLVKTGKDVIVLRTFSKLYGMAGLRCGVAIGRPDLLQKLESYGGFNPMPVTAVAAATASLNEPNLVAERKRINAEVRAATFEWLERNGYSYIPSVSNCFMLDTKRPAKQVIAAMAQQKVIIGRIWPAMPTYTRITIGTREEMDRFQVALQKVMSGIAVGRLLPDKKPKLRHIDGFVLQG
ncbi:MAG TPA: pyridoxal phosphate-dependent aminotransferase [Terracidiphilus sp.]|nr:pyridoxal phosphate-dependent aminotransferase [Terracidiphilus sp.]